MIFAARSRAGILALAGLARMILMQQANLYIKGAVQGLELKTKAELYKITMKKIAILQNDKMSTDGFICRITALKNKIDLLERSRATSRSQPKITRGFANDSEIFRHDGNQLMDVRNKTGFDVDLCSTRLADWLGKMKSYKATVTRNFQLSNSINSPQKVKTSRPSRNSSTMMLCQPKVMNIVRASRQITGPILQDLGKKELVGGAKDKSRKKSRSNRSKALIGGSRSVARSIQA